MAGRKSRRHFIGSDAPLPESGYLYKYRSLEKGPDRDNTLSIVTDKQLWWGRGSSFNDPFDCNHHIQYERTDEEWEELLARGLTRGIDFFSDRLEEAKSALLGTARPASRPGKEPARWEFNFADKDGNPLTASQALNPSRGRSLRKNLERLDKLFGVLCLSQEPDNILLWSHYANSHNGICLQFDVARHCEAFPRLHPVTYQQQALDLEAPMQDLFAMLQREPDLLLDIAALMHGHGTEYDHPAQKVEQWFYTKSRFWEYEREWRALITKPGLNPYPARALTGIIVGCVNTQENLALVREAARRRRPRPTLYVATKKNDAFALDIQPAD